MDAWEERLRATDQIKKLMALAAGNTNQYEAEAAMTKARALANKHGIVLQEIKPDAPMSQVDKMAVARRNAASFGSMFRKSYTGQDTEDYTKYPEEAKRRREERERKERGEGWDY